LCTYTVYMCSLNIYICSNTFPLANMC